MLHTGSYRAKQRNPEIPIVTSREPWSYAHVLPIVLSSPQPSTRRVVDFSVEAEIAVEAGAIGMFLADRTTGRQRTPETIVESGNRQVVRFTTAGDGDLDLVVRNGPSEGVTRASLAQPHVLPRFELDLAGVLDDVLPVMLRSPGPLALEAIASAVGDIAPGQIGRVIATGPLPVPIPFDRVLSGVTVEEMERMTDMLSTYDVTRLDSFAGYSDREYVARYLRQSAIRAFHLIELLQEMGLRSGRILEVGAFIGTFAFPLRRYGFEVTVLDRFAEFRGGIDGYLDAMRADGIEVVMAGIDNEAEQLEALGTYDAVISMAVIEHIPHTPRIFLEAIASHVAPGGILAIDTPNLARYGNRKALSEGRSVFQPIELQYRSGIPFGGHHREYTLDELLWMFDQIGARDVRYRLFDYNVLQFTELYGEHLDAVLAMSIDPTLADTLLVAGRVNLADGRKSHS